MTDKFDTKTIYQTPRGIAIYSHLIEPNTKFDTNGVYDVRMEFNSRDEQIFIKSLRAQCQSAYEWSCKKEMSEKLNSAPYPFREGKNGTLHFNFKMKASGVSEDGRPWSRRPQFFDARANEIHIDEVRNLRIGSGSELVVMYRVLPFYMAAAGAGISLRLEAVRIFKLVDQGKRDAAFFGFKPEDGYEHEALKKKNLTAEVITDDDIPF